MKLLKEKYMQKLFLSLLILFVSLAINAQDIIVTKQNDTIYCKIRKISEKTINYEQKNGYEVIGKFINVEDVAFYKQRGKSGSNLSNTRINFNAGGMSLLTGAERQINYLVYQGVPQKDAKRYVNDMYFITNFGGGIHHFSKQSVGIGIKYHFMFSRAKADFILSQDGLSNNVLIDDRTYFNYIAPSIAFQGWLDDRQKMRFTSEIAAGYVYYREEVRQKVMQIPQNSLVVGNLFGGNVELGLEYYIKKYLSIGANVGTLLMVGTTKSTYNYYDEYDYYRSRRNTVFLPTLTHSLSVRYHFNYKTKIKNK